MKRIEDYEEELLANKYLWDNNYSVRFKIDGDSQLQYIPNGIFMIELPTLNLDNIDEDKYLTITLRSTPDKRIEKEVFNILMNKCFKMDISLDNPNVVDFEFDKCSISKIEYAPLMHRNKSNFFNILVQVKVPVMKVFYGSDFTTFGEDNSNVDYMSLVSEEVK